MDNPSAYSFEEIRGSLTPESEAFRELREAALASEEVTTDEGYSGYREKLEAATTHKEALNAIHEAIRRMSRSDDCYGCGEWEEMLGQFRYESDGMKLAYSVDGFGGLYFVWFQSSWGQGVDGDRYFISWDDAMQYAFESALDNDDGEYAKISHSGIYSRRRSAPRVLPAKLHQGHDLQRLFSPHVTTDGRLVQLLKDSDDCGSLFELGDVEAMVEGLSRLMIHASADRRFSGGRYALMVDDIPVPKTATAAALARGRGLKGHFHCRPDVTLTWRKGGERKLCRLLGSGGDCCDYWNDDNEPFGQYWMEHMNGRYEAKAAGDPLTDGLILAAMAILAGPKVDDPGFQRDATPADAVRDELLKAVAASRVKVF